MLRRPVTRTPVSNRRNAQGYIEAKAVYVDEEMKKALETCPTNIYGVSKQICGEAQKALVRANGFGLAPADLKSSRRAMLPGLPYVDISHIETVQEICDVVSFLVDHRGLVEFTLTINLGPEEYVKLELTSTRLLLAPLFDCDYKIECMDFTCQSFEMLSPTGFSKWSASDPLMVDRYFDNFEGLHDLLIELNVAMTEKVEKGRAEERIQLWAKCYKELEGEDLKEWMDRKMKSWVHLFEREIEK